MSTPPAVRPTAAVIVATRDRAALLARSLPTITRAAAEEPGTVVVVVDQSREPRLPDGTPDGVEHLVRADRGVSRARNAGVLVVDADVVLFTDDDCLVPADWVVRHLDVLTDSSLDGSFGVVGGLARELPGDPVAVVDVHGPGSFPWLVGHSSNAAIRRAAFLGVGGFDERLGPGSGGVPAGEDADLIHRLLAAGGRLRSGTGTPVEHVAWRGADDEAALLRAYEAGAGAWIGRALRARRPGAARAARRRIGMLAEQARARGGRAGVGHALRLGSSLGVGVVRGLARRRWSGS